MQTPEDHIHKQRSVCCDAPLMSGGMCLECGEHAEAQPEPEEAMPTIDADPSKVCSLDECQPGLFFFRGSLGFKTEYRDKNGPEAYCIEGEYFWGGTSDPEVRRKLIVVPAFIGSNTADDQRPAERRISQ